MNAPSFTKVEQAVAEVRRALAEQDAEWREAQQGLRALGDVELALKSLPELSPAAEATPPVFGQRV